MSSQNYTLEVISHHPTFKNKSLRQYYVEGINTVGAWGDEPFEIKFTNRTYQKVQVKISLDGTDILSGAPATTDVSKDMWMVNGYGTLSLKAWPETNNGGAQFVFTSADKSVALHTHGDLSNRGIIAAAVFVEGHVEPLRVNNPPVIVKEHHHHYPYYNPYYYTNPYWATLNGNDNTFGISYGSNTIPATSSNSILRGEGKISNSVHTCSMDNSLSFDNTGENKFSASLESLVSVGAGQHVDQKITYVAGLIKPSFTETVRVKYLWWDTLIEKLKSNNIAAPHASGFPGDKTRGVNLGNTPRVGALNEPTFSGNREPIYSRV